MPGISNEKVVFEEQEPRPVFSGQYLDPGKSAWSIYVSGNEKAVAPFVESSPFLLEVGPVRELEEESAQEDQEQEAPSMDEQVEFEDMTPGLPSLELTFVLDELSADLSPPYTVTFEIDPCMTGNSDRHSFKLKGNDTSANVSFNSNGGRIRVTLSGPGPSKSNSGNSGTVTVAGVPKSSLWYIDVERLSGNPCYSLSGDITVT